MNVFLDIFYILEKIQHAINNGILNTAMINDKCRKVLMLKKWVGLDKHNIIDTTNLTYFY